MCNRVAQQLEVGRMMLRANIWSNSWWAIVSCSGGSLRGWEATGGLLVGMWWVTVSFTGWCRGGGWSKHESPARSREGVKGIRKWDGWAGRGFLG